MGKEGLIEADLEMTEVKRAQLHPLAGGIRRQQCSALEEFCHANTWNVTVDVHLSPAVASLSAELHFPQQKMPSHSLAVRREGCAQVEKPLQGWGSTTGLWCLETEVSSTAVVCDPEGKLLS